MICIFAFIFIATAHACVHFCNTRLKLVDFNLNERQKKRPFHNLMLGFFGNLKANVCSFPFYIMIDIPRLAIYGVMLVLLNDKPSQIIYTMIGFQCFIVFYTAAVRPYKFIIENIYQIVIELTVVVYLAISLLFEKHPPKSNVDFLSFYKVYAIVLIILICSIMGLVLLISIIYHGFLIRTEIKWIRERRLYVIEEERQAKLYKDASAANKARQQKKRKKKSKFDDSIEEEKKLNEDIPNQENKHIPMNFRAKNQNEKYKREDSEEIKNDSEIIDQVAVIEKEKILQKQKKKQERIAESYKERILMEFMKKQ